MKHPPPASCPVLIVQSASRRLGRLRTDEEARAVQDSLRLSPFSAAFAVRHLPAARATDLTGGLAEQVPTILHVSGRADDHGNLLLVTDDGSHAPVDTGGLVELLAGYARLGLRLVVLNTCWSLAAALAISGAVDCVLGADGLLDDRDAVDFAGEFYRNLAYGHAVGTSHRQARSAMRMYGRDPKRLPELHVRPGVVVDAVFPVGPEWRVPAQRDPVKPLGSNYARRLRDPFGLPRAPRGSH